MKQKLFGPLFIIFLLTLGFFILRSRQQSLSENKEKVVNSPANQEEVSQEEVTPSVDYLKDKSEKTIVVKISLETHSIDLSEYNFEQNVVLKDTNEQEFKASKTELVGAGHHRGAELEFPMVETSKFSILVRNLFGQKDQSFEFQK